MPQGKSQSPHSAETNIQEDMMSVLILVLMAIGSFSLAGILVNSVVDSLSMPFTILTTTDHVMASGIAFGFFLVGVLTIYEIFRRATA